MINSIDEAITRCKKVAEENESRANRTEQLNLTGIAEGLRECAREHRQLAEWLEELNDYKRNKCINCVYYSDNDGHCSYCSRTWSDMFLIGGES